MEEKSPAAKANKDIDMGPYAGTNYKAVCPVVADLYTDNLREHKKNKVEKGGYIGYKTSKRERHLMNARSLLHYSSASAAIL